MKFGWKTRVGLVLSGIWLCIVFLLADDGKRLAQALGIGALPLVTIWGIIWAIAGWRSQRPQQPVPQEFAVLEAKARRRSNVRTTVAVVSVFAIGIFAANQQFNAAGNEGGGAAIPAWLGEWLVYGLFAYAAFRAIPRQAPGLAAVLASLVVVGAVNYKAYRSIAEEQEARISLARAAPLMNRINSGVLVLDQEVKDAKLGVFEPLLLAQAGYAREIASIAEIYNKRVGALALDQMLAPNIIALPDTRYKVMVNLKEWKQGLTEYKSQMAAAAARGKLGIQAALNQMPQAYMNSTMSGFNDASIRMGDFVEKQVRFENDAMQAVAAIVSLLDGNPKGFIVDRGPPPNLLFRDEVMLANYRAQITALYDASKQQTDNQARLLQSTTQSMERLEEFLKTR